MKVRPVVAKKDYEEKYTHPEMREEIKEEIKQSDKGGDPGQWSARKSQLLTQEYEKRGGGYKGEQDESQKSLQQWTEEEWQTQNGDAQAREGDETSRYLPKEAWENMSEEEKQETEQKKREGSRQGQQYVENTQEAKQARDQAQQNLPLNDYDDLSVEEIEHKVQGLSSEEIRKILSYEQQHENRKTLVESLQNRIDD
ncbi:MAG: DUF5872 domain-containing protein [Rubrobacteraceae bacterium]